MINLERDQNHLKTHISFLFESGQVHGIYHSLNNNKLQFDCFWNHIMRPILIKEKADLSFGIVPHVKCSVIHKISNLLF